jgi:hypothetical protein
MMKTGRVEEGNSCPTDSHAPREVILPRQVEATWRVEPPQKKPSCEANNTEARQAMQRKARTNSRKLGLYLLSLFILKFGNQS